MPEVVFSVDQSKSMRDQAVPGHNRWHPDIPPAASVSPAASSASSAASGRTPSSQHRLSNDVRDVDLTVAHMLSGPIEVQGAEPGDLLVVDILDLGPCQPPQEYGDAPGQGWGYTGIFAKANGGGFLTDYFPDAYKAIWDFHGQDATSRHIPGVRYTGITHPGLFGTAPSADLLAEWNRREQALIDTDPERVPPLALPPIEEGVLAGTLSGEELNRVGREGARPVPRARTAATTTSRTSPAAAACTTRPRPGGEAVGRRPALLPGRRRDHVLRRDRDGRLHRLRRRPDQGRDEQVRGHHEPDPHPGPRGAALQRLPHLHRRLGRPRHGHELLPRRDGRLPARVPERHRVPEEVRLLGEQAYLLLGSAPIEGRVSGVVDIPNACCSLYLPTAMFDFDIRPNADGPQSADRGSAAKSS
jgi:formamidase